jgi:hypothetical protein
MRRAGWILASLVMAAGVGAQPFTLPSELTVTAVNGVSPADGEAVVTSSRNVAASFSTDANAAFVWIVQPTGTTGGSTLFPQGDSVGVLVPFGQENTRFDVRLCITAIAPSFVTTNNPRTFCGTGLPVILDNEPPEITVQEVQVGDRVERVSTTSGVRVNGDFVVRGTVRDAVASPDQLTVTVSMGGNETAASVDETGRFEASVSVSGLSDGAYGVTITAEDAMSDTSTPNRATLAMPP